MKMVSDKEIDNDLANLNGCPYDIIGVPKRSDVEICKQAFKQQILQHHPDKNGSKEIAQRLNYAKDCLSRHDWKVAYDRRLVVSAYRNRASSPASPPPSNTANVDTFTRKKQQPKQTRDKPKQDKAKQQKKRQRRTKHQEAAAATSAAASARSASQQPRPGKKRSKPKKMRSETSKRKASPSFSEDNQAVAQKAASFHSAYSSKPSRVSLDDGEDDDEGLDDRKMPAKKKTASSSDNSKMSAAKPSRDLKDLLFSPKLIKEIERVMTDQNGDSEFEKIVIEFIPVLESCGCDVLVKSEQRRFHISLFNALKKHGREELINVGDDINDRNLLLIVLHFATEAEMEFIRGLDHLSKMDYKESACIAFAKEYIASSIIREYARVVLGKNEAEARDYWNEHKPNVIERITTIDHRFFISRDKDNFQTEVRALAKEDNTTVSVLDVLGWMNGAFHRLNHNLKTGEKLSCIYLSTSVIDATCDGRVIPAESAISKIDGYSPHSEVFLAGYIKDVVVYTTALVNYFDGVMSSAFGEIFRQVLGVKEPFASTMALRHRNGKLTEEEIEALRQMLLESRIRGGTTCGLMRTLVSTIVNILVSSKGIETEEALALLPETLRELDERYQLESATEDSLMDQIEDGATEDNLMDQIENATEDSLRDTVYAAFKALLAHQPKMEKKVREKFDKLVANLSSLYKGSKLGGATTGLMKTLAKETFRLDGMTDESSVYDIVCRLEELNKRNKDDSNPCDGDQALTVFSELIQQKPSIVEDFESLASKLQSLHKGGATTGAMYSLSSKIYRLGDMTKNSTDEDITIKLQQLVELRNQFKSGVPGGSTSSCDIDALDAFSKLIEIKPGIEDNLALLSTKLKNLRRRRLGECQQLYHTRDGVGNIAGVCFRARTITIPVGPLKIALSNCLTTGESGFRAVAEGGVFHGKVAPGDIIISIDGEQLCKAHWRHAAAILQNRSEDMTLEIWTREI